MQYKQHPLSAVFPAMSDDDFDKLSCDIAENGLIAPIVLFDGMILDGWHRYRACQEQNLEPEFREFSDGDPVTFVQSCNLHRRHLSGSQRAAAVVACNAWAKPGNQPKGEVTSPLGDSGDQLKGEATSPVVTNEMMAKAAEVSKKTIKQAKRAHEAGLGEAVRDGKLTAEEASKIAKLPEEDRQAAIDAPKEGKAKRRSKPESQGKTVETQELPHKEGEPQEAPSGLDTLKNRLSELEENNAALQEENTYLKSILGADDRVKAAADKLAEVFKLNAAYKSRNDGLMQQNYGLARMCDRLKKRVKQMEEERDDLVDKKYTQSCSDSDDDFTPDFPDEPNDTQAPLFEEVE